MHWLKKGILFILSIFLCLSCNQHEEKQDSTAFDIVQNIDSVFSLAHEWTDEDPPIPTQLLDSLNRNLDSIEIHAFNYSAEPNAITFSAKDKSHFEIFEKTPTLKRVNRFLQNFCFFKKIVNKNTFFLFLIVISIGINSITIIFACKLNINGRFPIKYNA